MRIARLVIALAMFGTAACASRTTPAPAPSDTEPRARDERPVRVLHGKAVWYGGKWHGRKTASGERFNKHAMTAAHRSLPLGSRIRVINLENDRSVVLRVNDRGPYGRDRSRILDVSEGAARRLGFRDRGWVRIRIEVLRAGEPRRARETPARRRRR